MRGELSPPSPTPSVQGDAGSAPKLDYPINFGCLHPGNHTGQAECAGRSNVVSLPFLVNAEDIYKDAP